ncbi:MAG: UvrB/UvrC motif-containing protein [Spirochaetota bacterium]
MFRRKREREASSDISPILDSWEYDIRQEMMVRRIRGADGAMKIQMRLDLGLLQMNENGRPDGKKPHGKESLLSYFEEAVRRIKNKYGSDEKFKLDKDDCYALQQEGVQYYYRYLCFFQLGDYQKAERDTARNLRLFDFVKTYAAEEKYVEDFEQYRPYVMMMNTRAKVLGALKSRKVNQAVSEIHRGINQIERVYERAENSEIPRTEIAFLKNWAEEIVKRYTPTKRQRLEEELEKAVKNEEFERAAKIRDRLNRMKD